MPVGDEVYAKDLNNVFKKMHKSKRYKNMVVYIEACESGSMLDGILPENIGIYATTASDPHESSFGYYCDVAKYNTCLGDLYSIAWMEDRYRQKYNNTFIHLFFSINTKTPSLFLQLKN